MCIPVYYSEKGEKICDCRPCADCMDCAPGFWERYRQYYQIIQGGALCHDSAKDLIPGKDYMLLPHHRCCPGKCREFEAVRL